MSCAVALHPCLAKEPIAKAQHSSSALHSMFPMACSPYMQSKVRRPSHDYPPVPPYSCNPADQRSSPSIRSAPRSPLSEDCPEKPFKKLCAMNREFYSSASRPLYHYQSDAPLQYPPPSTSEQSPDSSPVQTPQSEIKYLSANCIVVTHYRGDAESVVDEHFSRALAIKTSRDSESPPKVLTRNFPASFYQPHLPSRCSLGISGSMASYTPSEIYEAYHSGLHSMQSAGADPWSYPFSSQAYSHRGGGADIYPTTMTPSSHPYQYSSVGFQQHLSRIPSVVPSQINKSEMWGGRYYDTFAGAADISNGIDTTAYSSHYNSVTASLQGIEAPMSQDCPKDLYWL